MVLLIYYTMIIANKSGFVKSQSTQGGKLALLAAQTGHLQSHYYIVKILLMLLIQSLELFRFPCENPPETYEDTIGILGC